jgi:geranylgeranyl diphosphate synthase, type II
MQDSKTLLQKVEEALKALPIPAGPADIYDPIRYTLDLGGKRIRPIACLMACELFGEDYRRALPAAISIEVFHNFTLLHDDIMDQSPLRRGQPTVYRKWNPNVAILSGDTMFALAYSQLEALDPAILPKVLAVFSRTAIEVCEGQQYDMDFEGSNQVSIPDYINMIRLKTAVLLAASLQIGALCAGASADQAAKLYEFGECTGLAFQLMDDFLDTFGDEKVFGKRTGNDIRAGKKTYLILRGLELDSAAGSNRLSQAMAIENPEEKVSEVRTRLLELGIKEETQKLIRHYHTKAMQALSSIKADTSLLQGLAEGLLQREF